jgi:hypothetical protein
MIHTSRKDLGLFSVFSNEWGVQYDDTSSFPVGSRGVAGRTFMLPWCRVKSHPLKEVDRWSCLVLMY